MIVLILTPAFEPGYKAGGPVRSLANLVACLNAEFEFVIATADRDLGDTGPYSGIAREQWLQRGRYTAMYVGPGPRRLWTLAQALRRTPYDILYLNSFFSPAFTIAPLLLRRLGLVRRCCTLIAPRGELAPGALSTKHLKKCGYRLFARALALHSGVSWQASSMAEAADILRGVGPSARVLLAPDIFPVPPAAQISRAERKACGQARLITTSRVAPVKNLAMLAVLMHGLKGTISLGIYGAIDDSGYWAKCQEAFAALPSNVTLTYHGPVDHDQVSGILSQADLFVLPTLGENFCHAAAEAFAAGCPVLISDQTPWRGLEKAKAGWDLPLDQPEAFTKAIQRVVDMDEHEHRAWRQGARSYIESHPLITEAIELNRQLFLSQIQS